MKPTHFLSKIQLAVLTLMMSFATVWIHAQ